MTWVEFSKLHGPIYVSLAQMHIFFSNTSPAHVDVHQCVLTALLPPASPHVETGPNIEVLCASAIDLRLAEHFCIHKTLTKVIVNANMSIDGADVCFCY